jgi:DNA polymerase III alpha subunit
MNYVPLRTYSVFSQGEGAVDPASLGDIMRKAGVPHLPVCDPMSLIGWEKFKKEADARGLKPLLGTEIRLPERGSLLLFPCSHAGYLSLASCLNRRALPAALAGVLAVLLPSRPDGELVRRLQARVGRENLYLGLEWQSGPWLRDLAASAGIPLAWAQPLRWIGDARGYAVARAVFRHLPLPEAFRGDESLDGLLPAAAIVRRFGEPGRQALANTLRLAERADFAFAAIGELFPDGGSELEVLVRRRLDQRNAGPAERERALQELQVIRRTGAGAYFLVAGEIAGFCRERRIFFNLRGSSGASFVLFLLGMSRVDPLRHGLLFERFVNSLRDDPPDIDVDIDSSRRPEVFQWLFERYRGRAAFVSSHKFFGARSALYETARAFGFGPDEAHALTRPLPMFAEPRELSRLLAGRPLGGPAGHGRGAQARVYEAAARLDGVFKELSLHVGGVVLAAGAIDRLLPLARSPEGFPQLAWDRETVERLRIFKLDLLGVRGFEVISPLVLDGGAAPDQAHASDAETWRNIQEARTVGCFQLESPLARENLAKNRPSSLEELAIAVAIIRPGPSRSGMKAAYGERRPPLHPLLGQLFPGSRGALIFEEQIAVLLHHVSGWSLEQAEVARKELKKKRGDSLRGEFLARGAKNGWSAGELELFWKLALDFSLYAFCQAHSLAYAHSAFLSAWMKTRRPLPFFCRLLNAGGGYYPLPDYIAEAKRWGLAVLPPDVNRSGLGFGAEAGAIRCGLMAVRGIGEKLAARLVESRGPGYASLEDLLLRTRLNERDLAALLAVSALSGLGRDGFGPEEKRRNWQRYLGFQPSEPS